jgi:ABC-type uncharacterized transport system permease subunit
LYRIITGGAEKTTGRKQNASFRPTRGLPVYCVRQLHIMASLSLCAGALVVFLFNCISAGYRLPASGLLRLAGETNGKKLNNPVYLIGGGASGAFFAVPEGVA